MTADNYLNVLAKVMREQVKETAVMNKLYHLVDEELYSCLEQVQFPSTPKLSGRLNQMLKFINGLSIYPELINKEIICLYGRYTNKLINYIKTQINIRNLSWIEDCKTEIPIIINDSSNIELEIDIVTSSFTKVSINKSEFELLLSESKKNGVAINQLIEFFVIRLTLKNTGKCYLLDNTYKQLTQIYDELITTKIYVANSKEIEHIKPEYIKNVKYLLYNNSDYQKARKLTVNNNVKLITKINFQEIFENKMAIISFYDIYKYAICPLESYYNESIKNIIQNSDELTNDIIRNENDILKNLSKHFSEKLKNYQQNKELVDGVLFKLEEEIKVIDEDFNSKRTFSKNNCILNEYLKDCMFIYYFSVININQQEEKESIKRILDYGYKYSDLLLAFSKSINKKNTECPEYNDAIIKNWECAKMLLHFQKEKDINNDIESMVNSLGSDRVTTGKEWYYLSLIRNDKKALLKAVQLGCDMANKKMYDKNGDNMEVKKLLASVLYPDACIDIGMQEAYAGEKIASISDKRLTYLKIAAAIGDNRGIQNIIDILFNNVIWEYFCYKGKPMENPEYYSSYQVYLIVYALCETMISQKINLAKYREYTAVINFCLNRNLSEVHSVLYNRGSDVAYFCKGYLAEYGLYNTMDLDKALNCYDKVDAKVIPAVTNAKKRVKAKIQTREKDKEDEYDKDEDYHGSYSSSSSSSWCFITTAASCALNKGRDCDELNFLRRFRDDHIKNTDEGNALVDEYYNIAPKIIEKIDCEEEAYKIYSDLWSDYIVPSVKEIKKGNWQQAQDIYVMMVVDLSRRYSVEINTGGYENLYHDTLKRIGYEK